VTTEIGDGEGAKEQYTCGDAAEGRPWRLLMPNVPGTSFSWSHRLELRYYGSNLWQNRQDVVLVIEQTVSKAERTYHLLKCSIPLLLSIYARILLMQCIRVERHTEDSLPPTRTAALRARSALKR